MQKLLVSLFGVSWRTALSGWIAGAMPAGYALMDAYQSGQFNGKNGITLAFGVMVVLRGYLMKDASVTGLPKDNIVKTDKDNGTAS